MINSLEQLTLAVEAAGVDIAPEYKDYLELALAIATGCGEEGRSCFHRICAFHHDYEHARADKFFTNLLRCNRGSVTLGTAFHLAKRAGVTVAHEQERVTKVTCYPLPPTHACAHEEEQEEEDKDGELQPGTGILQNIMDADGVGLIFESEADTISTAIGSDYGHWSDTLRLSEGQKADFDRQFAALFLRAGFANGHEMNSSVVRMAINVLRMMMVVGMLSRCTATPLTSSVSCPARMSAAAATAMPTVCSCRCPKHSRCNSIMFWLRVWASRKAVPRRICTVP